MGSRGAREDDSQIVQGFIVIALDFEQFGGHGEGGDERSSGQSASIDEDVPVLGADWQPTIDDGQLDIRT